MNVALPLSQYRRESSSIYVVTPWAAVPSLTPLTMKLSTLRVIGESTAGDLPSGDRTCPPAEYSSSRKSQVSPSYAAPWYTTPLSAAASRYTSSQVVGALGTWSVR